MTEHEERMARARQIQVLRAAIARLDGGEVAFSTDVFSPLERELEQRRDDEEIARAWAEQGAREPQPWVFARSDVLR